MVLRQAPPSSGTAPAPAGRNGPACCLVMGLLHKRHKGQGRRAGAGALVRADAPIRQEAGLGVAFRPVVGLFCEIWPARTSLRWTAAPRAEGTANNTKTNYSPTTP